MKWNKDQLEAIYTTNKDIVVSASAGAGKTSILVERLLVLCTREENPIDLDRIVALTFTEAAASEMKKRLSKALNNKLNNPNSDKTQIKKQLILLDTAQISTIHSFCLNIIKKYYDVINLNPAMIDNTLDEITVKNIKNKAFNTSFLNYSNSNDVLELMNNFSDRIFSLDSLKDNVLNIVKEANSVFDKEKWYEKTRNNYKIIDNLNQLDKEILSVYCESIINTLIDLPNDIDNLLMMLDTNENIGKNKAKFLGNLNKLKYYINNSIKYLKNNNYYDFYYEFEKTEETNFTASKFSKAEGKLKSTIYNIKRDLFKSLYTPETFVYVNNQLNKLVNQLIDLAILTDNEIKALKIKVNGFDFDDMERYAYQILTSNNNMIANLLKDEFDEILVDEFQDTNEIQNEIVNLISKGNNTFRVGDVKQSIYRFRKAKPSIMRNLMNNSNYKLISLKNNYRSKENIVNFTNNTFSKLMNINGFSDKYEEIDTVNIGLDSQKEYKPNTITFYGLKEVEDFKYKDNDLKARFISNKIKNMVINEGYKYKDFVILVRGHSVKKYIIEAFDELNIPYFIDNQTGFYSAWMSHILISFLKLIIDTDEIALMSVLTSPIYNLSDEKCAKLVIQHNSLLQGIKNINHPILNDISHLKDTYINKGISAVLDEIALLNNFINDKCNIQQRLNFDLFYEKALSFEKTSIDLNEFIRQINLVSDDKSSEALSVGEDDDVVKAMTIHNSKGLQFKVVFYWSTSRNEKNDSSDKVITDSELGFALDYIDTNYYTKYKSIQKQALSYKIKQESSEEFIRLLYVALTRAQEELYIVDIHKDGLDTNTLNKYFAISNTSGTKLLSSVLENDDIFNYECIDSFDFKIEKEKEKIVNPILPYYKDLDIKDIEVITPSKTTSEISLDIDLNRSDEAVNRGTLMHEYIETLPDRLWNKDDISKIIGLNQKDIDSLITFNKSNFFSKLLSMNLYHEYPFILKEGNSITNGIIDILAINDKEVIIVDLKSDRYITEESLINTYTSQIMHYVKSMKSIYPNKKIQAYIYSFTLNKEIPVYLD